MPYGGSTRGVAARDVAVGRVLRVVLLVASACLAACFAVRTAAADDAAARRHFREGVRLYDATPPDYERALAEFRAAYAEKASPSIQRNIALCLRGLGRNLEAIDALEAMLRDGAGRLKPDVEAAAKKAIAEMSAEIATIRIRVVPSNATVSIDGADVPTERLAAPIRVAAGAHAIAARAPGFADAERRVTVAAGDRDVDVALEAKPRAAGARGRLRVHASSKDASISIDGVPIATGAWEGELTAGKHRVEARAPGLPPWGDEVDVGAGAVAEVEIRLGEGDIAARPPPIDAGGAGSAPAPEEPVRRTYLLLGLDVVTGVRTLSPIVFDEQFPTTRGATGAGLMAKLSLRVTGVVFLEGFADVGFMNSKTYASPHYPQTSTRLEITYADIGPEVRLRTRGSRVRFSAGTGLLAHAEGAKATLGETASSTTTVEGGGVSVGWLGELGLEVSVSRRVSLDTALFFTAHGVAGVKNDAGERLFLNSPGARGGLRFAVDYAL